MPNQMKINILLFINYKVPVSWKLPNKFGPNAIRIGQRTVGRLGASRARRLACGFSLFIGFLISSFAAPAWAQDATSLSVTPTRIVLNDSRHSGTLTLSSRGNVPTTFRLSLKNMRMLEDGRLVDILEPAEGENFADEMLRFSPRQVVVEPDIPQTVRIIVRKPQGLDPGEYRSHLLFVSVPDEQAGADIEDTELEEGQIRIAIQMVVGISVPVIVRHGDLAATVTIDQLSLDRPQGSEGGAILSMRLGREGNRSVYGDLVVNYEPEVGDVIEVGRIRGIAVYTNLDSRSVRISLFPPDGLELRAGLLKVTYKENPEFGGNLSAEAELRLP